VLPHRSLFVHLSSCIMSTADIKYPPPAYQHHGESESAQKPTITSVQPRAGVTMVVGSDNDVARGEKAERLRGGCIPCPVCIDSSDCVQLTSLNFTFRTEAGVGSSRYRAVAKNKAVPVIHWNHSSCCPLGSSTPWVFTLDVADRYGVIRMARL